MNSNIPSLPDAGYIESVFSAVERHPMAAALVLLALIAGWAIHKGKR
jgi:hypothetical protein